MVHNVIIQHFHQKLWKKQAGAELGQAQLKLGLDLTSTTGCFKKNGAVFILQISRQTIIGFSNLFFLLKTEIHM